MWHRLNSTLLGLMPGFTRILSQVPQCFDRTHWSVNYGSGKLYDDLGMHLVNDDVSLQIRLIAR